MENHQTRCIKIHFNSFRNNAREWVYQILFGFLRPDMKFRCWYYKTVVQKLNSIFFVGKYNGENYFCWIGPLSFSPTLKQNVLKKKEFLSVENEVWWILKMEIFDYQRKILMCANINWSFLKFWQFWWRVKLAFTSPLQKKIIKNWPLYHRFRKKEEKNGLYIFVSASPAVFLFRWFKKELRTPLPPVWKSSLLLFLFQKNLIVSSWYNSDFTIARSLGALVSWCCYQEWQKLGNIRIKLSSDLSKQLSWNLSRFLKLMVS